MENLQWVTTKVLAQDMMDLTVTVSTTKLVPTGASFHWNSRCFLRCQTVLDSLWLLGLFLMDMVVKVLSDLTVDLPVVVKVELAEADSLRLHTSKKYSEISKGGYTTPFFNGKL